MQQRLCKESSRALGGLRGKRAPVESAKGTPAIDPILRIVLRWIGHTQASSERRENKCRRSKCLMLINPELIVERQWRRRQNRRHWSNRTLKNRRGAGAGWSLFLWGHGILRILR